MLYDHIIAQLLAQNKEWAAEVEKSDPGFFERSAQGQEPKALWFGCSDSRAPESVITASMPGVIFTHRNIANQCPPADDNFLAVLDYAVSTLKVPHVIVVGHTECGGVAYAWNAAHDKPGTSHTMTVCGDRVPAVMADSPVSRWVAPLTAIAREHPELSREQLGVANVHAQVQNIAKSEAVQRAWERGEKVWVHGWEYDLATGHLRDLCVTLGPSEA